MDGAGNKFWQETKPAAPNITPNKEETRVDPTTPAGNSSSTEIKPQATTIPPNMPAGNVPKSNSENEDELDDPMKEIDDLAIKRAEELKNEETKKPDNLEAKTTENPQPPILKPKEQLDEFIPVTINKSEPMTPPVEPPINPAPETPPPAAEPVNIKPSVEPGIKPEPPKTEKPRNEKTKGQLAPAKQETSPEKPLSLAAAITEAFKHLVEEADTPELNPDSRDKIKEIVKNKFPVEQLKRIGIASAIRVSLPTLNSPAEIVLSNLEKEILTKLFGLKILAIKTSPEKSFEDKGRELIENIDKQT
ncbi:MAG: hypothetical protein M1338_00965 [Patescibacteria group bacterium]|nr:hypothetical protein [Patescibacteria group bacterium]